MKVLDEKLLLINIELKRKEMYKSALENGFTNAITIKISQELDKLLNSLIRLKEIN